MLQWSNYLRQSLYNRLLVILLMTLYHDLTGETGSVQAWTYNYSVTQNLDWDSARQWCRQHYTDMVAIQNQEEIVYLNTMLPRNSQNYWIGLRKVNEMWTWMGTNKTLTKEAENWATGEPNNIGDREDCVEIYIKTRKDEAKWNDERCTRKKGPLCYTGSCSKHCCSIHAECLENIGNYTCKCDPGFKGPQCQEVVRCGPLSPPAMGNMSCVDPLGASSFTSSCGFSCEEGYLLRGDTNLTCLSTGQWTNHTPACEPQQCDVLTSPPHGYMNCSDLHGQFQYGSQCLFSCEEGFLLNGLADTECTSLGTWSRRAASLVP